MNDYLTHADLPPHDKDNDLSVLQDWCDVHDNDDVAHMGDVFHTSLKALVHEHFGTFMFDVEDTADQAMVEDTADQAMVEYTQFDIDSIMRLYGSPLGPQQPSVPLWGSLRSLVDAEVAKAHTRPGRQA
jgi:hypothetical protein